MKQKPSSLLTILLALLLTFSEAAPVAIAASGPDGKTFLPFVGYINTPPEIPDTTKVISEETNRYLETVSDDQSVFIFSQNSPDLQGLAPGDIMVGGITPASPYGYLRRVVSVSQMGSKVNVQTAPATLEQAIVNGSFFYSGPLGQDGSQAPNIIEGVSLLPAGDYSTKILQIGLNDVVLFDSDQDIVNTKNDQIRADGIITLEPILHIEGRIIGSRLETLNFSVTGKQTAELNIKSEIELVNLGVEQEIFQQSFLNFVPIGPVEVIIVTRVTLLVGADGSVSVGVESGITQENTITAGLSYSPDTGFQPNKSFEKSFQYSPPTLTAGINVKLYAGLQVALLLFGVAGPYAQVNTFLELDAKSNADPWWTLYAGVELVAGVDAVMFSEALEDYETTLMEIKEAIAQADLSSYQAMGVVAGRHHTCALTKDGRVFCWGRNWSGQLGNGSYEDSTEPVAVSDLPDEIVALAAGWDHTCALTVAGGVECWGANYYGQLGDGTDTERNKPVSVSGLSSGVTAIAAGGSHTCALTSSGGVKCWGANNFGQLGVEIIEGRFDYRMKPVNVIGLNSVVKSLTAGAFHSCAVTADGSSLCWGGNWRGQLGDGTRDPRSTPVTILASDVYSITAGGGEMVGLGHTCASTLQGAMCWGEGGNGQLGIGYIGDEALPIRSTPQMITGYDLGIPLEISAGGDHTCARSNVGAIHCWGSNVYGQLGDGTKNTAWTPVRANADFDNVGLATGLYHTCTIDVKGRIKCWGLNNYGQLGDGTNENRNSPVYVIEFGGE